MHHVGGVDGSMASLVPKMNMEAVASSYLFTLGPPTNRIGAIKAGSTWMKTFADTCGCVVISVCELVSALFISISALDMNQLN